jgi:hypothetical protein
MRTIALAAMMTAWTTQPGVGGAGIIASQESLAGGPSSPMLHVICSPGTPWTMSVRFPRPVFQEGRRYVFEWYVRPNRGGIGSFTAGPGGRALNVSGPVALEILSAMSLGTHVAIEMPREAGDNFVAETGGLAEVLQVMREARCERVPD